MRTSPVVVRLLCVALWLGAVLPSRADELPDVSQISIEDARSGLAADGGGVWTREFCDAVMKSERKDLIELCMIVPYASGHIYRAMKAMPDSAFRRELVLLLLRAPIKWWPDVPGGINTDMERMGAVSSIAEFAGQYLPDMPITYEVIGSPERRRQVADAFEAAFTRITTESNPTAARGRTGQPNAAGAPLSGPSAARRAAATADGSAFNGAYAGLWFGGALLLAAAGVGYYKWRTRRLPSRQA